MTLATHEVEISFGDCDPAGIVFYPHYFRFMDATFHKFLRLKTGQTHEALCRTWGARGIGLVHADLDFRAPAENGMVLACHVTGLAWQAKTVGLSYRLESACRLVAEGKELRCIFMPDGDRMRAASVSALKDLLA